MTDSAARHSVVLGVDTHRDTNVAAALDPSGRLLGTLTVPTTDAGHAELLSWANTLGDVANVGIEGTGSYGAGLSRHLRATGLEVLDVDRPDRRARRRRGKTDVIDAEIAARAVLAGTVTTRAKMANGDVESLRMLRIVRRSAMRARTQTANQLHALIVTAPEKLRTELRGLSLERLVTRASKWRPGAPSEPVTAAKIALKFMATRHRALTGEVRALDRHIRALVMRVAPALVALPFVGPETAAALLIAAGDNPERLRSEASFAHLCGAAPIPASSGQTNRHRLDRGGNREANCALYIITIGRLAQHDRTRAYMTRRTAEGLSKREVIRCLKRFVAREVWRALVSSPAPV